MKEGEGNETTNAQANGSRRGHKFDPHGLEFGWHYGQIEMEADGAVPTLDVPGKGRQQW